ncbi:MAG: hypothetical protein WC781_04000 [Candidatus Pacearchaeota archaeon]|jgi:hypothetical protein
MKQKFIPNFRDIEDEIVGYRIRANTLDGPNWLEALTFGQFIPPYSHNAISLRQVYRNLEQGLKDARKQQDSVTDKKGLVMLEVLANATLQREAMMNSMLLIEGNYF